MREYLGYAWGMIRRPGETLDHLARLRSIRPAVFMAVFPTILGWINYALFLLCGYDWLGTRRELADPTYVGFFGQLRVGLDAWVPVFHWLVSPSLALLGLCVLPGLVHVLCKLWSGKGTFEQTVNTLVFAQTPSVLVRSLLNDMLLAGVPANLLARHPYAFTAAMRGEFGSPIENAWWLYMLGIYILGVDLWIIALGTMAIRRVQGLPTPAAACVMACAYLLWFYGVAGSFVR